MVEAKKKSWMGRNWMWVAPAGCLGVVALLACFAAAIVMVVFGFIKSSSVYEGALAQAREHPAVVESIGTPVEDGLFVTGNITVNGPSGRANLAIPLTGPEGRATLYVVASKSAGAWTYSTLAIQVEGTEEQLNLLE